ncbi:MAG: DUF3857 domain-containing protein [Bdellovibrionales bacterium]|nr:DUF3857 domain-containing protein [Bdellovibrionales bacterium]
MSLLVGAVAGLSAHARRVQPEDLGFVTESYSEKIRGESNGLSVTERHIVLRILSPIGAERAGLQHFSYNASSQKMDLVEAYTLNGKQRIPVLPANVETRSISASGVGFDDQRRLLIPFPQLVPGSKIVITLRTETHTASLKDALFGRIYLPNQTPVESYQAELDVPEGVQVARVDPKKILTFKSSRKGARHLYQFSAKDIPASGALGERSSARADQESAWIEYSSLRNWDELAERLSLDYEKILGEALPRKFAMLVRSHQKEAPLAAMTGLWKDVIKELRYFGDWRTVKGAYVPRALSDIAASGYGDCKDFAAFLAKSFRDLGLDARVAIIERGTDPMPTGLLPMLDAFNHAITVVTIGEQSYFVDGTNPVPHPTLVPYDIQNRPYLELNGKHGMSLQRSPTNPPGNSVMQVSTEFELSRATELKRTSSLTLKGITSWDLQNMLFGSTEGQLKDLLLGFLRIPEGAVRDFKFVRVQHQGFPEYRSDIDFELTEDFGARRAGPLLSIPLDPLVDLQEIMGIGTQDRVSALHIDDPTTKQLRIQIPHTADWTTLGAPRACSFTSPWFDFERRVTDNDHDWTLNDTFIIRTTKIDAPDLKSPQFRSLQAQLRDCVYKVDGVFGPRAAIPTEKNAEKETE